MRDRRVPDVQAETSTTKACAHDVEAEEGEAVVVIDAGDGRDRLAVDLADEETFRVRDCKAGGVAQAGIPALGRGPVDRDGDLLRPLIADLQIAHVAWPRGDGLVRKSGLRASLVVEGLMTG